MDERIREIRFRPFRGLPDYTCKLNGKSIAILGGTGKGKSAIVDGIEFFFSGSLRRFHGRGSGKIDADTAMRHILEKGQPQEWDLPEIPLLEKKNSTVNICLMPKEKMLWLGYALLCL